MADDQKVLKKRLKVLMNLPQNQVCSDCPERQPRWASLIVPPPGAPPGSLPIGAFCCLECSGSHRRLGVHISFVRSINLDSWKEKEVLAMENGGNAKVNAIFEAQLPNPSIKPSNHADGPTRERFIRDKYERRKYYDAAGFAEYAASAASQPPPQQQARGAPPAVSLGPPSDAAKQRLEQRRARISKASSTVDQSTTTSQEITSFSTKTRRKVVAKSPVSAPPPASIDLLDLGGGEPEPNAAPEQPKGQQQLDLFDFLTADKQWDSQQAAGENTIGQAPAPPPQPQQKQQAFGADILSLYSGGQHLQPHSFANFGAMQQPQQRPMMNGGGGMQHMNGGGMPNNNMMMNSNGMQQMTNAMQNMQFQQPQMTQQQQLYQQQQMMLMQQQQQQQQRQQQMMMMNNNMHGGGNMMQGGMTQQPNGFGAPMGNSGPAMNAFQMASPNKPSATPEKEDPFAQFGSNFFRS